MSEPREPGAGPEEPSAGLQEGAPRRREPSLLRRSPVFALLVVLAAGWLLWDFWPDVRFFLSPNEPIDLGAPGAYHLDRARTDRLVQVRGDLREAIPIVEGKSVRMVGRLAGTNLLVDRPGRDGPPLYEGRLLAEKAGRTRYAPVVAEMRARGTQLGDAWLVLRDGERPRKRVLPIAGSAVLLVLLVINLRALLKSLVD
jgi:hypothetical protein